VRDSELRAALASRDEQIEKLKAENELLREKIDLILRKLYGPSSEKLDAAQLELLLDPDGAKKTCAADCDEDAPAADSEPPASSRRQRRRRPGLPEDLEVLEETVDPDEVLADPDGWRQLGEEVSERLEFDPARYWLRRIIRRTWVKRGDTDRAPLTAPLQPCLLEASLLSPSLAAQLLSAKFCDHLPFYRQEQILARGHGIQIGRNTMCHWAMVCASWLEPLYKLIAADLRQQPWVQVDETPIDYLAPGHGRTKQGYLWTYHHPEVGVLYDWHAGRGHQCLDAILNDPLGGQDFRGILLSDAFSAYGTWQRKHEGVILAACWAHVRRKFHEAAVHHPSEAAPILQLIAKLFAVEQRLRNQRAGPGQVHLIRQEQSRPILDALQHRLTSLTHCLPKSTLGRARSYVFGLWGKLQVFLEHGEIPLDNNRVENAIRPTKLGAKNWLFIGGADTGQRSAILYTFVENIRNAGADPFAYLKDVFERLPAMTNQDDLRPLLPLNWLASHTTRQNRAA
jgi:transposase